MYGCGILKQPGAGGVSSSNKIGAVTLCTMAHWTFTSPLFHFLQHHMVAVPVHLPTNVKCCFIRKTKGSSCDPHPYTDKFLTCCVIILKQLRHTLDFACRNSPSAQHIMCHGLRGVELWTCSFHWLSHVSIGSLLYGFHSIDWGS